MAAQVNCTMPCDIGQQRPVALVYTCRSELAATPPCV
jgi:hypothetical protein